jgi:hypothetical protein
VGDPTGRGGEVPVGVLGVEPGLDGMAALGGPLPLEPTPGRDVELELDEVGVGRDLGDRVLHLEAGVDFEEGKGPVGGLEEELHRAGPGIPDGDGEPLGALLEHAGLRGGHHRGGGFLDDLLVAALNGAVADPDRPSGSLAVGDDLDLDVPRPRDEFLQEDDPRTERALGLVPSELVCRGQLRVAAHPADAATPATGGRLEHEGVADSGRGRAGLLQGLDAASAPGRDRDPDLLGDEFAADLVAELAHGRGAGPHEGDPDPRTHLGELGMLGDEAPAHPGGVGARLHEGAFEDGVVEIRPGRRRAEVVGDIGFADEHRPSLTLGVECDHLDPVAVGGCGIEVADRVDQPHRCLPAVDDSDAGEHRRGPPGCGVGHSLKAGGDRLAEELDDLRVVVHEGPRVVPRVDGEFVRGGQTSLGERRFDGVDLPDDRGVAGLPGQPGVRDQARRVRPVDGAVVVGRGQDRGDRGDRARAGMYAGERGIQHGVAHRGPHQGDGRGPVRTQVRHRGGGIPRLQGHIGRTRGGTPPAPVEEQDPGTGRGAEVGRPRQPVAQGLGGTMAQDDADLRAGRPDIGRAEDATVGAGHRRPGGLAEDGRRDAGALRGEAGVGGDGAAGRHPVAHHLHRERDDRDQQQDQDDRHTPADEETAAGDGIDGHPQHATRWARPGRPTLPGGRAGA